jgi:Tol biopolymer transport system component
MDIYTVTKPDMASDPSYSPDGTAIVFVELIGSTYKISTVTTGATSVHTVLQSGSAAYADPYYSADGQYILFAVQTGAVSGPHPHGQWALKYIAADGTGLSTILNDGNANIHPCWITRTQIAFQYWEYGVSTEFQIALIDLAGQGRTNLGDGEYPRGILL